MGNCGEQDGTKESRPISSATLASAHLRDKNDWLPSFHYNQADTQFDLLHMPHNNLYRNTCKYIMPSIDGFKLQRSKSPERKLQTLPTCLRKSIKGISCAILRSFNVITNISLSQVGRSA